jgi:hypothetical protein
MNAGVGAQVPHEAVSLDVSRHVSFSTESMFRP